MSLERENAELRAALEHALEALTWHKGTLFEQDGQLIGQRIASILDRDATNRAEAA